MRHIVVAAVYFCALAQASAQQLDMYKYLVKIENGRVVGSGVFDSPPSSFEELKSEGASFKEPRDVLRYLVTKSPELRSNYVLVHNSESQQVSSLTEPRVILFGGGRAYAFSNHPGQKKPRVEIMEVSPANWNVEMKEIVFDVAGPRFVDKPQSCAVCHGSPAKPLWNPYDFWPNTFASAVGEASTQQEVDAFASLSARASSHPLLSELEVPAAINRDNEDVTAFTEFIHQINLGRWITQNLTRDRFPRGYALPLMAALSYCTDNLQTSAPGKDAAGLAAFFRADEWDEGDYQRARADVIAGRAFFKNHLDQTLETIFGSPNYLDRVDHARMQYEIGYHTQMKWVLARAGIRTDDLSTSLFANDLMISAPTNSAIDFLTVLAGVRPDLFDGIPTETIDLFSGYNSWLRADCATLKRESLAAPRAPAVKGGWKSFREYSSAQPVLTRCAKCHVEGLGAESAPPIPFHQPQALAKLLAPPTNLRARILERVSMHGPGQMPPQSALTATEIKSMKEFLETL